tara:strand:- start:116 stop:673 length:558 start_codon:yes stop_codon:yes gene_type:complete
MNKIQKVDKETSSEKIKINLNEEKNENDKVINFKSELNDQKNNVIDNHIKVLNFRDFVEMFFKHREGILHTKLYNDVTLISFKDGEVKINTEKIKDASFNRQVAKCISTWTGRIWQIHSSTSNLGKSLLEEDIINQQKEIELMKNNIQVKKILKEFPDSKIHSITELVDIENSVEVNDLNIKKEN